MFLFLGCVKIDYENPDGKIELSIQPIDSIDNSTLTDVKINLTNRTSKPIIIVTINPINEGRVSKHLKGTSTIETWKHKFIRNSLFYYEIYHNTDENRYVIPEIHVIKEVVYPQKTKVFNVPIIIQSLTDEKIIDIAVSYYTVDSPTDIMEFKTKYWIEPNKKERVEYQPVKSIPKKLEESIISSHILGKSKEIVASTKIAIKNPLKGVEYPWFVIEFVKDTVTGAYLFSNGADTFIVFKDGKQIYLKDANMVRDVVSGIMKGEVTISIPDELWETISPFFDGYKFQRKLKGNNYQETKYPYSKLMTTFLKLYENGYMIYKGMIIPVVK